MSIRFESVTKKFGNRTVLDRITFEVKKGEILFILGRSGMGKSVTLKQIVGLMSPDQGEIYVDDTPVLLERPQLARIRKKCGMVFQHPALLDSLTIFENIAFGIRVNPDELSPLSESDLRERVLEKLRLVNLEADLLEKKPPEISYGMQKRVSLARTLAPQPQYLLFDEPTTGLDPITTTAINDLIFRLSRTLHVTSVVVSHDMNCALKIADRILVLDEGRILALGTPSEIRMSAEPLIQAFMAEVLP